MLIDNGIVLHGWDKKNQRFSLWVKNCGNMFCQGMNW